MASSYSIGKHFEGFIEGLIDSGRYATASEVMREGLRLVEEREERRKLKLEALRAEIQKGFDSGPMEEIDDLHQWLEDIKAIWDFIASDSVRAADKQIARIGEIFEMLLENPLAGRERRELRTDLRS